MRVALKTPDGRTVVVDTKADEALYTAPCNPPNTGTRFPRACLRDPDVTARYRLPFSFT